MSHTDVCTCTFVETGVEDKPCAHQVNSPAQSYASAPTQYFWCLARLPKALERWLLLPWLGHPCIFFSRGVRPVFVASILGCSLRMIELLPLTHTVNDLECLPCAKPAFGFHALDSISYVAVHNTGLHQVLKSWPRTSEMAQKVKVLAGKPELGSVSETTHSGRWELTLESCFLTLSWVLWDTCSVPSKLTK